jgi:hypothetical protein
LAGINGGTLREWRRSRGWDVPKTARELRHVASEPVVAHDVLVRMIRGWERGDHDLSERYELLYRHLGLEPAPSRAAEPEPDSVDDASSVTSWVAASNTTDDAIEETAALLLAQEAEADEAIAWSVQAKTARWTGGLVEAAEFARRGFEVSRPTPTRVELTYCEANAIALFGDAPSPQRATAGRTRR